MINAEADRPATAQARPAPRRAAAATPRSRAPVASRRPRVSAAAMSPVINSPNAKSQAAIAADVMAVLAAFGLRD